MCVDVGIECECYTMRSALSVDLVNVGFECELGSLICLGCLLTCGVCV